LKSIRERFFIKHLDLKIAVLAHPLLKIMLKPKDLSEVRNFDEGTLLIKRVFPLLGI